MKKVLSLVAIMAVTLIALTGCVSVNYEVTLNKDGTADVAYVYGIDKEILSQMGTTSDYVTSDMKQNAETGGYETEEYSDDEIEGFRATKHVDNLADISLSEAFGSEYVTDSEENQFKIEKSGIKTKYSQNAKIDLSNMDTSTASMVTMKYTVKLPTKVGENNAAEVSEDGKTLTWNLTAGEVNEINFEATSTNIAIIILIVVIVAAIIVAVVIVAGNKSKKGKEKDKAINNTTIKEIKNSADKVKTEPVKAEKEKKEGTTKETKKEETTKKVKKQDETNKQDKKE